MKAFTLIVALTACTTFLLAATAPRAPQPQDEELAALRAMVQRLDGRVTHLENRPTISDRQFDDSEPQDQAPTSASGTPDRIMILDGSETLPPKDEGQAELDRVNDEIRTLERTTQQLEREVSSMTSSRRSGTSYRSSSYSRGGGRDLSTTDRKREKNRLLADYKRQLGRKLGEARDLEEQLTEVRQLIVGHWEGKIITLQTTRDLSRTLSRHDTGDTITWRGRRTAADESSEDWIVTSFSAAD